MIDTSKIESRKPTDTYCSNIDTVDSSADERAAHLGLIDIKEDNPSVADERNIILTSETTIESLKDLFDSDVESIEKGNLMHELREKMIVEVKGDDSDLEAAIAETIAAHDRDYEYFLYEGLSGVEHPRVEELGRSLITSDDTDQVLAGLKLLSGQRDISESTAESLVDLFAQHEYAGDEEVLLTALDLVSNRFDGGVDGGAMQSLKRLLTHESEEVRFSSLRGMAKIAKSDMMLEPVVLALDGQDKLGALIALHESKLVSEDIRSRLIAIAASSSESDDVIEAARVSLDRYSLSEYEINLVQ